VETTPISKRAPAAGTRFNLADYDAAVAGFSWAAARAELDGLREVAAAMGNSVEPLPEGLWSSIASRLPERQAAEEPPPMPSLGPGERPPFRAPRSGPGRRSRNALAAAIAVAVAAAAAAVVLGISLVHAEDRVSSLQGSAARGSSAVTVALHTPGHRLVQLRDSAHTEVAEFVVVPDGRGYLVSSRLPSLGPAQTYQLWGIVGGRPISLGLLGSTPNRVTFTMAGSRRPSRLAVTAEPAGGTVAPTGSVLAAGTV